MLPLIRRYPGGAGLSLGSISTLAMGKRLHEGFPNLSKFEDGVEGIVIGLNDPSVLFTNRSPGPIRVRRLEEDMASSGENEQFIHVARLYD